MPRRAKDMPFHLDRGTHAYRKDLAVEFREKPGEGSEDIERILKEGMEKMCPVRQKRFKEYAIIYPSDNEIDYYCPLCDALVMHVSSESGKYTTEILDRDHISE
ncbi:hypothetical protein CUJ83_02385 [Methanocella sp. CWC-04]|uniref:Uncharacterized protein n=1 Tax=Methanooceanicella nereidis TaxID=2052831 RepID=A0AAP2RD67_9EURY|nr:hypothetical protein [Methanocella sp. CWC-04]MCD1293845.1 hypothetical protein [Methanocella sp. CWC-04]